MAEHSTQHGAKVQLPALTGVRALAAFMVLLLHASQSFPNALVNGALSGRGYLGVDFFFLLSGFIIAHVYLQRINAWRDNESSWYYQLTRHTNHPVVRGFRMIDALTPWRARGGAFSDARSPSTLFVRVYLPESAWKLHLARIVTEARRAKQGSVLHFWLHPHNLGADVPRGVRRLEQVLDAIDRHAPRGSVYASMRDLAVPADRA